MIDLSIVEALADDFRAIKLLGRRDDQRVVVLTAIFFLDVKGIPLLGEEGVLEFRRFLEIFSRSPNLLASQ